MRFLKISALLIILALTYSSAAAESQPLICYVGGTMRPAVEKILKQYEIETGRKVECDYSSSGEAIIKLRQTGRGDIIVVHDPYAGFLEKNRLAAETWTVASLAPVIVVPRGNPKGIKGLTDLGKPGIRIIMTDSMYSTLGHVMKYTLLRTGSADKILANVRTFTKASAEAANAVALKTADAAVVWKAVAYLRRDQLDTVSVESKWLPRPGIDAVSSATYGKIDMSSIKVTVSLLKCSKQSDAARELCRFMAGKAGKTIWDQQGYGPASVSAVKSTGGELLVHCAAGLRRPVERIAVAYKILTGTRLELNYSGSNRLLGQIKLTRKGDLFIAGDRDYIESARKEGLAGETMTLCRHTPVIMVQKNNPKKIQTLGDMTQKNIRIGQGDERSAAVGALTMEILARNKIDLSKWSSNVVMKTQTVNELGNAVKLKTIDAAVVWHSIAIDYPDDATIVPLNQAARIDVDVDATILTTARDSRRAQDFLSFMTSEQSKKIFRECGFTIAGQP